VQQIMPRVTPEKVFQAFLPALGMHADPFEVGWGRALHRPQIRPPQCRNRPLPLLFRSQFYKPRIFFRRREGENRPPILRATKMVATAEPIAIQLGSDNAFTASAQKTANTMTPDG
jgi:hypothetical protein